MMDLLAVQLTTAVGCFVILMLIGCLPLFLLKNDRESQLKDMVLSLMNCFACGVFLSTCFLGLVPHVRMQEMAIRKTFENTSSEHVALSVTSSWTDLSLILGFLMVLVAEQLMTICSGGHAHAHDHLPHVSSSHTRLLGEEDSDVDDLPIRAVVPVNLRGDTSAKSALSFHSIALLLGLGVHTVFEGVALGLQASTSSYMHLYLGVMLHEVLCAFAFGTALAKDSAKLLHSIVLLSVLAAMIPFGIIIAFILPGGDTFGSLMGRLILEGLAAGTFVYVACVEMLPAELGHSHGHSHSDQPSNNHISPKQSMVKTAAVLIGFLSFLVLSTLNKHD